MAGSWIYPQTLDKAGEICQGETLYLIMSIGKIQLEKVL
jgi:hypothetical protein